MKGQNLRQLWESQGPQQCLALLSEGLRQGEFRPADFSLRELAESFCGHEWVRRLDPAYVSRLGPVGLSYNLMEAGDAVDVSAFQNITGQLLFTRILEGWKQAMAAVEGLYETVPTQLDGEREPFLGRSPQEGQAIGPGMPYPEAQFGERYVDYARGDKYGQIVSLTKEMVFFDKTAQALKRAGEVGERLGMGKAKRLWDVILGITDNLYKLNGTAYATYATTANRANLLGSWPLVDYTSVEKAYVMATKILDPDTSNPIEVDFKQLLVMPAKLFTARRIVGATALRTIYPGYATQGSSATVSVSAPGNVEMESANPLPGNLEVRTSAIAFARLLASGVSDANASDYWYIGDFPRAFCYRENWPLVTVQAPANSEKEFEQDIVHRVKASERGVAAVQDFRYALKFYNG